MTNQEIIAVIQAYEDGKTVQYEAYTGEWYSVKTPEWNFQKWRYRVKPEPEPPKYVPFSFEDDLVGKVLIEGGIEFLVIGKSENGLFMNGLFYTFEELLENWKLKDGSPCGKLQTNE